MTSGPPIANPAPDPGGGRLFVAVPLAAELRRQLAGSVRTALGDAGLPGRVATPDNWHVTLRFLGDTDAAAAARLAAALAEAPLGRAFRITFDRLGAFPKPGRGRVIWLGVGAGADELAELAAGVERAVRHAGLPAADKPFQAHLTLARLDPPQDLSALVAGARPEPVPVAVDEVVLFRSHLGRGPARHEPLAVRRLQ
jgi:2'-5' RNA ligase